MKRDQCAKSTPTLKRRLNNKKAESKSDEQTLSKKSKNAQDTAGNTGGPKGNGKKGKGKPFSNSADREKWVSCTQCHNWSHAACTDGMPLYVCHHCDSD